jgi:hypothetical protein
MALIPHLEQIGYNILQLIRRDTSDQGDHQWLTSETTTSFQMGSAAAGTLSGKVLSDRAASSSESPMRWNEGVISPEIIVQNW